MNDGVVSNGRSRIRHSQEYRVAVDTIRASVREEYRPLIAEAGLLGKIRLVIRRRRQLEREIEALAPRDAHYLK